MVRSILPRLADVLFSSVLLGCLLIGQRMLNIDSDLGRHLTLGNYMLEDKSIPLRDVLSFTKAGESRPPYEWLAEILFALAHRLLGMDGVVLLTAAVIASAFLAVYLDGRSRGGFPLVTLALTVWAAAASSLHWLTRPHVFSFLLLAVWLRSLEGLRLGRRPAVWQLPVIMLVWANTHGSFVVAFLAWLAYFVSWLLEGLHSPDYLLQGRRLLTAGGASLIASILTPDLWSNWAAVLRNNSAYVLGRTGETMPPDLGAPATWPFLGLIVLSVVLAILARRRISRAHILLLAGLAGLGLVMARNIPLFSIAAVPILAMWWRSAVQEGARFTRLEEAIARMESGGRGFYWPMVVTLLAAGFLAVQLHSSGRHTYAYDERVFPVQAADWIESQGLQGRMLNELNWGGYLLYRLWPAQRVFIDSQSDFYGEDFIRDYVHIMGAAEGWQAELDRLQIAWLIIPPRSSLAERLQHDPHWSFAYGDSTAVIYLRGSQ